MKRPRSPTDPPQDAVLLQLDALINGAAPSATEEAQPPEALPPVNPVLSQLDALINGGAAAAAPPPLLTPAALVLPLPPPLPAPQEEEPPEIKGPPGLLREFGGVIGYMNMLGLRAQP